jgi:hypothetical protein
MVVFAAQTASQTPSPLNSAWTFAVVVLLATAASRILAESLALVNSYGSQRFLRHLLQIIEATLLLAPLPATWILNFRTTVPLSALVGFGIAYLATVVVAHILSFNVAHVFVEALRPDSSNTSSRADSSSARPSNIIQRH